MVRPKEMPEQYSDNHILTWLSEWAELTQAGNTADFNLIYADMCRLFNLNNDEMKRKTRVREIIIPKHLTMYVSIRKTRDQASTIGKFFNADHSIVNHAYNSVCNMLETGDRQFLFYWDIFKKYSRFYSSDLDLPKRKEKRATASLVQIKNEILEIFNITDSQFIYSQTNKYQFARYFYCKVATMIGHVKVETSTYIRKPPHFCENACIAFERHYSNHNEYLLSMWQKYIARSVIYKRASRRKTKYLVITGRAA